MNQKRGNSEKTRKHLDLPGRPLDPGTAVDMRLGKYRLKELVGEGEFGRVYKATVEDPGTCYAVKILKSRRDYGRFQQECRILERLKHKALPQFIETGISQAQDGFDGAPYLVMEFVAGESLQRLLQRKIAVETALRWGHELSEAVSYLHGLGVVHRDLKPSNILISSGRAPGKTVRILDLGIAALRNQKHEEAVPGTLRYMSPEQMDGSTDRQSDIYAMGLILYELIQGFYPYDVAQDGDWWDIHHHARPRELQNSAISPRLADVVMSCLNKNPSNRPTAETVAEALGQEISGVGIPSHIGIYGPRGSGKTCYLTSLYHEAEVCPETRKVLESLYLDLFEHGKMPPPTILSARRLNFYVNTPNRFYDIVTRDYGGELLEGRSEDAPQGPEFEEKREEIYQFFQGARAILILVETMPADITLRQVNDHQKEIEALTARIARIQEGVKRSSVPLALVLTKWDRVGDISRDEGREKTRAVEYIEGREWLKRLYRKLKILYPPLEVFPVFSFIGDSPGKENIRAFNLCAPLLWAADVAERNLVEQCESMAEGPRKSLEDRRELMEKYWSVLYVEKIGDADLVRQVEDAIAGLSAECLEELGRQSALVGRDGYLALAARYRDLERTRGLAGEARKTAGQMAEQYERAAGLRKRVRWLVIAAALLSLLYPGWRLFSALQKGRAEEQLAGDCQALLGEFQMLEAMRSEVSLEVWVDVLLPRTQAAIFSFAQLHGRMADYRRKHPGAPFCAKIDEMQERMDTLWAPWKERVDAMAEVKGRYVTRDLFKTRPVPIEDIDSLEKWRTTESTAGIAIQKLREAEQEWQSIHDRPAGGFLAMKPAIQRHILELRRHEEVWLTASQELQENRPQIFQRILQSESRDIEGLKQWADHQANEYRQKGNLAAQERKIEEGIEELKGAGVRLRDLGAAFSQYQGLTAELEKRIGEVEEELAALLLQAKMQRLADRLLLAFEKSGTDNLSSITPEKSDLPALLKLKLQKTEDGIGRLAERKRELQAFLQNYPGYLYHAEVAEALRKCERRIADLEKLQAACRNWQEIEEECREYRERWREKIVEKQSYRKVAEEIERILDKIAPTGLSGEYRESLLAALEEVRSMRARDRRHYKEIEDLVEQRKFRQAGWKIWDYQKSTDHFHIGAGRLADYLRDFRGTFTLTIYLTPSKNFDDGSGGGDPDFIIFVTYLGNKTTLSQNTPRDKRTEMGKISGALDFELVEARDRHWLYIYVKERDPFEDETYGNMEIDIGAVFDNDGVYSEHTCEKDGSIEIKVEPEFTLDLALPEFQD